MESYLSLTLLAGESPRKTFIIPQRRGLPRKGLQMGPELAKQTNVEGGQLISLKPRTKALWASIH